MEAPAEEKDDGAMSMAELQDRTQTLEKELSYQRGLLTRLQHSPQSSGDMHALRAVPIMDKRFLVIVPM